MSLPDDAPKFPKLPFIVGDIALLGAAVFIAVRAPSPLSPTTMIVIASCVGLGAILAAIAFLADYTRAQESALAERQDQIAALAQTTATSAEQLSIAAASLHGIAENSAKNLKLAEQLPHKLQEKINEFNQQLSEGAVAENETLQQELNALRASEAEKLETITTKVHKTAGEMAKLEATLQKQLASVGEVFARLPAAASEAAQVTAAAITQARAATEKALVDRNAQAESALDDKLATALAEIDGRLARLTGQLDAHLDAASRALDSRIITLEAATRQAEAAAEKASTALLALRETAAAEPASTPKRRRASKDSAADAPLETPSPASPADSAPVASPESPAEAPPAPVESLPATTADEGSSSPPVIEPAPSVPPAISETPAESPAASASLVSEEHPPAKSRTRKAASSESEPELPLILFNTDVGGGEVGIAGDGDLEFATDERASHGDAGEAEEGSLTSDGFTRLVATAYIGIGNRLYLRGEGPGLSWEKGVPLQFISIGKWRWETSEATGPITAKLFKNDETECTSLGAFTLTPGYLKEVKANF